VIKKLFLMVIQWLILFTFASDLLFFFDWSKVHWRFGAYASAVDSVNLIPFL